MPRQRRQRRLECPQLAHSREYHIAAARQSGGRIAQFILDGGQKQDAAAAKRAVFHSKTLFVTKVEYSSTKNNL